MVPELRVINGGIEGELEDGFDLPVEESRTADQSAEEAVTGVVLALGGEALDQVEFLKPEHFVSERCRRTFEAALWLRQESKPIDIASVKARLQDTGRLSQVGGIAWLSRTMLEVPSEAARPGHLRSHGCRVRDLSVRRDLGQLGKKIKLLVETSPSDVLTLLTEAQADLKMVQDRLGGAETDDRVDVAVPAMLRKVRRLAETSGKGARPTGFPEIDALTRGLHAELVVVGARPGMGKTSLATAIAVHVARAGEGVYIASIETLRDDLLMRMACAEGGLPVERVRVGDLSAEEWARIEASAAELQGLPLWVDEAASASVAEIYARCRRVQLELRRSGKRLGLVVVDYLQLLRAPRHGMSRQETVSESARGLRTIANELEVTVLALSQLKRPPPNEGDRPQVMHLRESGEIEQAARTILLLNREDEHAQRKKKKDYRPTGLCEVIVAKQNNGGKGSAWLAFDAATTRFTGRPVEPHAHYCQCGRCPNVESPRDQAPVNAPRPEDPAFWAGNGEQP